MKGISILGLFLAILVLSASLTAQATGVPRFSRNESYKSVRIKMLKAGWKPYHSSEADECDAGDTRCEGRPEMQACSGTGKAPCSFLWKRKGKLVRIVTSGEDASYAGHTVSIY